jgi:peptide/nickel transport system substrate-binding protein
MKKTKKISKKIFTTLLFLALTATVMSGCSPDANPGAADSPTAATGENAEAAVLYHAYVYAPYVTLDPSSEYSSGIMVLQNVYETLTRYNDETEQLDPLLATSWKSNDDGTEWVFSLRDDVTFHDGSKMTAANVVSSITRTIAKAEGAAYNWDPVDTIEATGDYEVTFKLKYAAPIDLISSAGYAAYIMSDSVIDSDTEWFNRGNDGGSGPYAISRASGDTVVLKAFEDYRDGWKDSQYKNIIIKETAESGARRQLLESGEAQIASDFSVTDLNALKEETDKVAIYKANTFTNKILFLNTEATYLDNADFRRALAYAFPYEETINNVIEGNGTQSRGLIPAGLWGHDDSLAQYTTDLDKAGEYLGKSGVDPAGVSLDLTYISGLDADTNFTQLFQVNLKKLGIELNLQSMEWDAQWDKARNNDPNSRQDIFIMQWWPDYASPSSWFDTLVRSEDEIVYNLSYIKDAELDAMIGEAGMNVVTDRDRAEKIYIDIQKRIIDECFFIFAYDSAQTYALSPGISGVHENPAYATAIRYYYVTHK